MDIRKTLVDLFADPSITFMKPTTQYTRSGRLNIAYLTLSSNGPEIINLAPEQLCPPSRTYSTLWVIRFYCLDLPTRSQE